MYMYITRQALQYCAIGCSRGAQFAATIIGSPKDRHYSISERARACILALDHVLKPTIKKNKASNDDDDDDDDDAYAFPHLFLEFDSKNQKSIHDQISCLMSHITSSHPIPSHPISSQFTPPYPVFAAQLRHPALHVHSALDSDYPLSSHHHRCRVHHQIAALSAVLIGEDDLIADHDSGDDGGRGRIRRICRLRLCLCRLRSPEDDDAGARTARYPRRSGLPRRCQSRPGRGDGGHRTRSSAAGARHHHGDQRREQRSALSGAGNR